MGSVNRMTIIGNLGADPEVRYMQDGTPVCSMRIATTDAWTGRDGQKQEKTEWHAVSVWGKVAESCGQYLAKGRQVFVEGRLESREYEDKEGVQRKAWEVRADRVVFLGSGRDNDGERGGGQPRHGAQQTRSGSGGGWGGGGHGGAGNGRHGGTQHGHPAPVGHDDDPIPF